MMGAHDKIKKEAREMSRQKPGIVVVVCLTQSNKGEKTFRMNAEETEVE